MSMMTFGDVNTAVGIHLVAKQLKRIEPVLVLSKYARNESMPKNKGEIIKWRRVRPLAVSTVSLTEGVTPPSQNIVYDTVTTVISEFGGWVSITNKIQDLAEDRVLNDAMNQLGDQAAATKEMILWGVLRGGTSVYYANGSSRSAVNTPIDLDLVRAGVNNLKRNHAKPLTRRLAAGPNVTTEPVMASYVAYGHVDLDRDIREAQSFVPVEKYATGAPIDEYEIGKLEGIRIILSPDLPYFADAGGTATGMRSDGGTSANVYPLVIIGEEFFGDVALKGMNAIEMAVFAPGKQTESDPLGQRGGVAWKMYYQAIRLNEAYGTRLEVAATALS